MAHGRQQSEWAQTLAVMATINNLFAAKPQDVRKLMPAHVLGPEPRRREPTAEEVQANWQLLRDRVRRGGRKHGRE